jgi:hypothetical protein
MGRVWALAGAIFIVLVIFVSAAGFFGEDTLKFAGVIVGAGAVAAYLPGGVALSRAVYLFVGAIVGAVGFGLGAMAFPDTVFGGFLGAVFPVLVAAIVTMWSRKPEAFLTMLLGSGALGAYYTTAFYADPQSINYSLPIAIGAVVAPLGLGYLAGALIQTVLPSKTGREEAELTPDPSPPKPLEPEPQNLPLADLSAGAQGGTQ